MQKKSEHDEAAHGGARRPASAAPQRVQVVLPCTLGHFLAPGAPLLGPPSVSAISQSGSRVGALKALARSSKNHRAASDLQTGIGRWAETPPEVERSRAFHVSPPKRFARGRNCGRLRCCRRGIAACGRGATWLGALRGGDGERAVHGVCGNRVHGSSRHRRPMSYCSGGRPTMASTWRADGPGSCGHAQAAMNSDVALIASGARISFLQSQQLPVWHLAKVLRPKPYACSPSRPLRARV